MSIIRYIEIGVAVGIEVGPDGTHAIIVGAEHAGLAGGIAEDAVSLVTVQYVRLRGCTCGPTGGGYPVVAAPAVVKRRAAEFEVDIIGDVKV